MKEKDPRLKSAGVQGYNKPKRTPNHPTKSHVVVAKEGDQIKTIRFGQQGVSGAGKAPKSEKEKSRRKSFKARHAKNIAKGKMSAAYWANKEKWQWQVCMIISTKNVNVLQQEARKRCVSQVLKVRLVQKLLNKQPKKPKGEKSSGSWCSSLLQKWV